MADRDQEFGPSQRDPNLQSYRISQLERRMDHELKDLRDHFDRCMKDLKNHVDEEMRDIRADMDKRFQRIENFILAALCLVATSVVGAIITLVLKTPAGP